MAALNLNLIAEKHNKITNPPSAVAASAPRSDGPLLPPADPRVRALWEILSRVPSEQVESTLGRCGLAPRLEDVEAILRHSYAYPAAAVTFFRWSGQSLKHTPYAWNLMVDILGKNGLFDAMWDAIRSMKQEGAISIATFASAFGSYCAAGRVKEAVMTFDVMDRYGVPQDVVAVNSLLSAICSNQDGGGTAQAADFFDTVKSRVAPDADTFAILLEGWEKEGNVARAKSTFGEMVVRVGWSPDNMPAYDAFLTTLVRANQTDEALNFLHVMKSKGCLPGMKFFGAAFDPLVKARNAPHALALWDVMVTATATATATGSALVPNAAMYNAMIGLLCDARDLDAAYRLLDAMPFHGAFPDAITYNTIFECLICNHHAREAERFLAEMRKNEQPPSPSICAAAIRMFFNEYDPSAALEVWNCVVDDRMLPNDEPANELLLGLRDLGRLTEVRRYAEDMLDMGIQLKSSTMDKLKSIFDKAGKLDAYDRITRRLKQH